VDWDDGTRLEGAPADPYPGGVLHVRPGEIDGRHVLRAWLDALLCSAGGTGKPVMLVGLGEQDACSFALPQLAREAARGELRALIELCREGRCAPLPFFVRASWKHALACAKAEKKSGTPPGRADIAVFEKAANQAEGDNGFGGSDEFGQDAVCMAWRGRELPGPADGGLAQDLHRLALAVFARPARAWAEQFP
jgi:exonuclease V gamma subunit